MFQIFHDEFRDNWEICKIPALSSAFYSNKYLNNDSDKHYYLVNKMKKFQIFNNHAYYTVKVSMQNTKQIMFFFVIQD